MSSNRQASRVVGKASLYLAIQIIYGCQQKKQTSKNAMTYNRQPPPEAKGKLNKKIKFLMMCMCIIWN